MPKITAPTVAEHRARQRTAILDAARTRLAQDGYSGLTYVALAKATGLARTSLYEYFPSRPAIVLALCQDSFPPLIDRITEAVHAAAPGPDQVAAYIRAQLEWADEDKQRLAASLAIPALPGKIRAQIRDLHLGMVPPLVDSLTALGHPEPGRTAALVQGIVNAATLELLAGDDVAQLTNDAIALALHGLSAGRIGD
jgi:AcrR family transcriptional regulator